MGHHLGGEYTVEGGASSLVPQLPLSFYATTLAAVYGAGYETVQSISYGNDTIRYLLFGKPLLGGVGAWGGGGH